MTQLMIVFSDSFHDQGRMLFHLSEVAKMQKVLKDLHDTKQLVLFSGPVEDYKDQKALHHIPVCI